MSSFDSTAPAVVWFRDDLRVSDHPALARAAESGRPVIGVYVFDERAGGRALGGAARWWLHGSLRALDAALAGLGGRLVLLRGDEADTFVSFVAALGAGAVYWNRRYAFAQRALDNAVQTALDARRVAVETFNASLLFEPDDIVNGDGRPYQVFGAYWRAALRRGAPPPPLAAPRRLNGGALPEALARRRVELDTLGLEPTRPDWAGGLRDAWRFGEDAAHSLLRAFVDSRLGGYATERDRPGIASTSRLSPYVRFGNLSVRQIWHAAVDAHAHRAATQADLDKFLSELGWREFCWAQLYRFPDLPRRNLRHTLDGMPWRGDPAGLAAWRRGATGYPFVDAGMRELWATGWMHNRARMVCASFLVKHLLIDWREGEAWFWDTLVDADAASNAANWQWVAGCGADAAPYFRIFNPVAQGKKFDPDGAYVRRWVPELAGLPPAAIHEPWAAPPAQLAAASVRLGDTYPVPVVAHDAARRRALDAFATAG
ncbi:FAD binding domain of DNA photolyase family protein [Burkholderia thailandensis 34]|uniref:cryptochrome/photolyase family protein n=1 Tax=Burkholderia thailandensis TaxID=57975 RepID=UPI0005D9136E|nr:deoxyribodipyrimidine photo-lyase [Burkholderia thailandensis]AJY29963.1 FAD binding domain of DNA photolyase family protein [Burkholderia thailandensis 34]AOJ57315.1 deoxyribodipyrimidine photolyase [Burkholderia thailandensis]KXF61797.1 deoxyribodipyrimidine photolyase [Burkholderia thailandensis]PNE74121.1 deoxyribodipyrimidine photo-lyase [Burkholderia thailandensis]